MKRDQVYISIDVEADGPIPGAFSMLSLGAVSLTLERGVYGRFSRNLHPLVGAQVDPDTMRWWHQRPAAWAKCREELWHPAPSMRDFRDWIAAQGSKPVCIAYPAGFDWTFLYWYLQRYLGASPFGFTCLDIKSYASALLHLPFRDTVKRNLPPAWFSKKAKHSHVAVEDAEEQAELWLNMLRYEAALGRVGVGP